MRTDLYRLKQPSTSEEVTGAYLNSTMYDGDKSSLPSLLDHLSSQQKQFLVIHIQFFKSIVCTLALTVSTISPPPLFSCSIVQSIILSFQKAKEYF
jgi:hypothetical protein